MTYQETLHRWAAHRLPEGAKVTGVKIDYNEGHAYSEWTFDTGSLWVTITYTLNGEPHTFLDDPETSDVGILADLGEMLTEMFAIEDAEQA